MKLAIGTRQSALALWQTNHVAAALQGAWPGLMCEIERFDTKGDQTQKAGLPLPNIGGKGLFTAELEEAIRHGRVRLAVHSLKDLPVQNEAGLTLGAILPRADVRDVLVARGGRTLVDLPTGATIGTSSPRRAAQLRALRADVQVRSIRGNVGTRIGKVLDEGLYDAVVLALAGVMRLELTQYISYVFALDEMLPAPGQGALAVQCRADDAEALAWLAAVHDGATYTAVTAERAFLSGLGGGCSAPVGAYAEVVDGVLRLRGVMAGGDGRLVRVAGAGDVRDPHGLGERLAREVLAA